MGGTDRGPRRGWLAAIVVLPALWHVVALGWIVVARLTYPMDLEWMEGGELYEAHRLAHGEPVFGPPDQGYVPFAYPPLHPAALAGLGRVVGLDYWSGRLLSVACIVLAAVVVGRELVRHGGRTPTAWLVAGLGVGLAAAAFPVTGGWYDLVRNDSMALALPVAAAGLVSDPERLATGRRWIAVALLLVAGVYTKQTDLFFALWIVGFLLVVDRRTGWRIMALATTVGLGTLGGLQLATDGWMLRWLRLMAGHDLQLERLDFGLAKVLRFAPYLVAVVPVVAVLIRRGWLSRRAALWLGMLLCAFPAGLLPYVKVGGYENNLMPIVFLAGPVSLLVAMDLWTGLADAGAARLSTAGRAIVLVGAAVLLVLLRYPTGRYVPDGERRGDAEALNELVGSLDGDVLVVQSPFLAVRNGSSVPQVHVMAHIDAVMARLPEAELERFVAASEAEWVLTDGRFAGSVRRAGGFDDQPVEVRAPEPVTGHRTAPRYLYHRAA